MADAVAPYDAASIRLGAVVILTVIGTALAAQLLSSQLIDGQLVQNASPGKPSAWAVTVMVLMPAVMVASAWHIWRMTGGSLWSLGLPLLGIFAVSAALFVFVTEDVQAGRLFLLTIGVLYGALYLRPAGAWVAVVLCVLTAVSGMVVLLPPEDATNNAALTALCMSAITIAGIRLRAAEERSAALLREAAETDALTGLATRAVLRRRIEFALRGAPSPGSALLLIDMDHLKTVNDKCGHACGDALLRHAATVLEGAAAPDETVARLGGDELAVAMPRLGPAQAAARAETFFALLQGSTAALPCGQAWTVQVSAGLAHVHWQAPATNYDTLYDLADAALYQAKRAGRGRLAYAPTITGSAGAAGTAATRIVPAGSGSRSHQGP